MRPASRKIFLLVWCGCRGGQWNSGGQCHKETEPIFNETFIRKYPSKMRALEPVLRTMRTQVTYLNISRLTDYRKDGHPSIYRKEYKTVEEEIEAVHSQDCSHWCLPGVPDTWNELLYASLLLLGRGSWGSWGNSRQVYYVICNSFSSFLFVFGIFRACLIIAWKLYFDPDGDRV